MKRLPRWVRDNAAAMRLELEARRLSVVLIPAPFGGPDRKIRAVEEQNPGWYRDFCAAFETNRSQPRHGRKPDTLIKRRHTLRALKEIEGGVARTTYAERLLPWVQAYVPAGCPIPADDTGDYRLINALELGELNVNR